MERFSFGASSTKIFLAKKIKVSRKSLAKSACVSPECNFTIEAPEDILGSLD
jgi:hypothetical protein